MDEKTTYNPEMQKNIEKIESLVAAGIMDRNSADELIKKTAEIGNTIDETRQNLVNTLDSVEAEYGEDSVELEATGDFAENVDKDLSKVSEDVSREVDDLAEQLKGVSVDQNQEYSSLSYEALKKENEILRNETQNQKERLNTVEQQIEAIKHPARTAKKWFVEKTKQAFNLAKDTVHKIDDNVKGFINERKKDILLAVDTYNLSEKSTMRNYEKQKISMHEQHIAKDTQRKEFYENLNKQMSMGKEAVKNIGRLITGKPTVDIATVQADIKLLNSITKSYSQSINAGLTKKYEAEKEVSRIEKEMDDIAGKWQNDVKRSAKVQDFMKKLDEIDKQVENQVKEPRTQSKAQER